ncbi:MAG: hypothetical protein K9L22_06650 [Methylococcaceae bacterium]|nr:hypothetical protein [Methylococcaceae bacterium]
MSTPDQRKRYKAFWAKHAEVVKEWGKRGYCYPPPVYPAMPEDLRDLRCGAKTRAGTPCMLNSLYGNGRCKYHGGLSTGATSKEGKAKVAKNGFKQGWHKQSPCTVNNS